MKPILLLMLCSSTIFYAQRNELSSTNGFANYLSKFSGAANAMHNGSKLSGSVDIAIQTFHFFMVTGIRNKVDSLSFNSNSVKQHYRGFEFFLINRAALDFDSIQNMANNYLTSLQGAPLTLRFMKELFLTKNRIITSDNPRPVVSLQLNTDLRASPYYQRNSPLRIGGSGHLFLTLSSAFTRLEFENNQLKDQGTMYFLPTFGVAILENQLAKSIMPNSQHPLIFSAELKMGFQSDKKSINDTAFIIRYSITDVMGPRLYTGIILSSIK
jgi:hypothetical protein